MEDFKTPSNCPKCGSNVIIVLDINTPPRLFECRCGHRFHSVGFSPSQIDAGVSLSADNINAMAGILKKQM